MDEKQNNDTYVRTWIQDPWSEIIKYFVFNITNKIRKTPLFTLLFIIINPDKTPNPVFHEPFNIVHYFNFDPFLPTVWLLRTNFTPLYLYQEEQ